MCVREVTTSYHLWGPMDPNNLGRSYPTGNDYFNSSRFQVISCNGDGFFSSHFDVTFVKFSDLYNLGIRNSDSGRELGNITNPLDFTDQLMGV